MVKRAAHSPQTIGQWINKYSKLPSNPPHRYIYWQGKPPFLSCPIALCPTILPKQENHLLWDEFNLKGTEFWLPPSNLSKLDFPKNTPIFCHLSHQSNLYKGNTFLLWTAEMNSYVISISRSLKGLIKQGFTLSSEETSRTFSPLLMHPGHKGEESRSQQVHAASSILPKFSFVSSPTINTLFFVSSGRPL